VSLNVNPHVERLRRFQPFHADSADLVHEQADHSDTGYRSVALDRLLETIEDPDVQVIVLTGDAGHGKTHLCSGILRECGFDPEEAKSILLTQADGQTRLARTPKRGRPIRMIKDLSELTVEVAGPRLQALLEVDDGSVSVVCANEGLLRRTVSRSGDPQLQIFTDTLRNGLETGDCVSDDRAVHVLNLNYQSVTPASRSGLVDWALRTWAVDGRSWRSCKTCGASEVCPILANHRELADRDLGQQRRTAVRTLFATAERTGVVVTIRQALAAVAYAVTGGLRCDDVHRRWGAGPLANDWQHEFLFHQAVFGDRLTGSQRTHVPVIDGFRRLDPGRVALRMVDDAADPDPVGGRFQPPVPSMDGPSPRSRRDAKNQGDSLRRLVTFLRRRSFFEDAAAPGLTERMGLRAGDEFGRAADGELDVQSAVSIRDHLLRGLEAVQGLRRSGSRPDFFVLDPAFVNYRSRAAIIARKIQSRDVRTTGQVQHWSEDGELEVDVPSSVDWQNRVTYLTFDGAISIPLDLFRFELLHRWADGLSARVEHESAVRHLNGSLARLVPQERTSDEIIVLIGNERRSLMIDVGELIRSGDG
jgi:hypothetical protein